MKDDDIRRAVLRRIIADKFNGVANQLAIALGKPPGQINDMLSRPPRKSFGAAVARQIEEKLGLSRHFLDDESNAQDRFAVIHKIEPTARAQEPLPNSYGDLDNEEKNLVIAWRNCSKEQREMFRLIVSQVVQNCEKSA